MAVPKVRPLFLLLFGIPLVLVVALMYFRAGSPHEVRTSYPNSVEVSTGSGRAGVSVESRGGGVQANVYVRPEQEIIPQPAVRSGQEDSPLADVYPSSEQAIRAMAASVAGEIESAAKGKAWIRLAGPEGDKLMQQAAGAEFRKRLVSAEILASDSPATQPSDEFVCTFRLTGSDSGRAFVEVRRAGTGGLLASRQTGYVEKEWLSNFPAYAARNPGNASRIYVTSPPCPSRFDARNAAARLAAEQLAPQVRMVIQRGIAERRFGGGDMFSGSDMPSDDRLKELVAGGILSGRGGLQDEFGQRIDRQYGAVYQVSMLVSGETWIVSQLADDIARQTYGTRNISRNAWANQIGGLAVLGVLVLIVYLLLNAATKGYYAWTLRLITLGALVAGAIVLAIIA